MKNLEYELLKSAVAGNAAAFRLTLRLDAVSPKVFPPTYEGCDIRAIEYGRIARIV